MPLSPDVALSVQLDAICSRSRYTHDPAPVVDELRTVAGGRTQVRDASIGEWVGYFRAPETEPLCAALLEAFPDAAEHVPAGRGRRGTSHTTADF